MQNKDIPEFLQNVLDAKIIKDYELAIKTIEYNMKNLEKLNIKYEVYKNNMTEKNYHNLIKK